MFGYDNIGGKIKSWAKWIFGAGAIAAIIAGFVMIIQDSDMALVGLLTIILGPIVAWVSSWLLYGFGQLIENSDIIAAEYSRKNEQHEKVIAKANARKLEQRQAKIKASMENPNIPETEYIDVFCPECQAELSFTKEALHSNEELSCPFCNAPIFL